MSKETIEREVNGRKRKTVIDVKEEPPREPFDPSRMVELAKVGREEFNAFLKNYPKTLSHNFFMDWDDWHDFSLGEYPYSCVARMWGGAYDTPVEYYIPASEVKQK